jgi:putative endonuclease
VTPGGGKADRQHRERRGHASEYVAAALLIAKGYRILARRFASTSGEIDLIVCRGRRLAFVEVKRRATLLACQSAVTQQQRRRIRRAADLWLARYPRFRDHDIAFDAVFVTGRGWPRHFPAAL